VGLEADAVRQTEDQLRAAGCDALASPRVTRQDDVDAMVAESLGRFGRRTCSSIAPAAPCGQGARHHAGAFRELMELNLLALVRCTRAAVPELLKRRGHVVNIGSLAAKSAVRWVGLTPPQSTPCAYSQQLRLELGPQGLHVLLVSRANHQRRPRLYPLEGVEDVPSWPGGPGRE